MMNDELCLILYELAYVDEHTHALTILLCLIILFVMAIDMIINPAV